MPLRKVGKSATSRGQRSPSPVPQALAAARRALHQQTARVSELEGQIRKLTARREPVPDPPDHVALTDTDIYFRRRLPR